MYIPVPVESGCENRLFTSEPMLTLIVVPGMVGSLFPYVYNINNMNLI